LDEIESRVNPHGVYGFFPANSIGEDIVIYNEGKEITRFNTLRQQKVTKDSVNISMADFVAPLKSGVDDFVGGFIVTSGSEVEDIYETYKKENDDYKAFMIKVLANRIAESFSEYLHKQINKENNFITQGIRPAIGYPCLPDHSEKVKLFTLLEGENNTDVILTDGFMMKPVSSVCGLYIMKDFAKYFAVDGITNEQLNDYASRKGEDITFIEKMLANNYRK
ncbi:MAG: vitamin B12 dependent-methionine synthase activation domain-containing protein, partial [Clostridium sp.]